MTDRLSQGVFIPGINGFTRLRQSRWFLGLLKSRVWAATSRGQGALQIPWDPHVISGGGLPDTTMPLGDIRPPSDAILTKLIFFKCSGTILKLGSRREVQNINHSLTCPSSKISTRVGMMSSFFRNLLTFHEENFSDFRESHQNQDLKPNNDGNRTYLIISKPVNLQNRYQQTKLNHHHRDRTKPRNDSSQLKSNIGCSKSERERSYSKSREKEDKKQQQKICLVLSGD